MNNDLEVISLTKNNLREAIGQNKYWGDTYEAPFSKNKAKWILENSRADKEDTIAILGYENNSIMAFVFLVPDWIQNGEGGVKKIYWSHRWWVSDLYKDTILPTYVKSISLNKAKNQIVIKFLGDNAKAYYEKQPFTKFSERERYIILFSFNYNILIQKKKSLKQVAPLIKVLDKFSYKLISVVNALKQKRRIKNLAIEHIVFIDNSTWNFIGKYCTGDVVPKTQEYINWQISNDQYHVLNNRAGKTDNNCLLGSISNNIYNLNFIVKKEDEIIGFVSGFVSGNRFTVRYFIANEENFDSCVDVLINKFIETKSTLLQTENSILGQRLKNRYLTLYTDTKQLFSLIHNDVGDDLVDTVVTDQDGNFL